MQLLRKVLNKLNGYAYRQEYLCLADGPPPHSLHAYIVINNTVVSDITHQHLFTGYCPLIFAFSANQQPQLSGMEELEICFSPKIIQAGSSLTTGQALAWLKLRRIRTDQLENDTALFYEGTAGHHRFIPAFNQFINSVNNSLYQQKTGNVYLDNRLYPQVQIAYALPRRISLISLSLQDKFNLFPTDLHGQINAEQYIVSLRHGGMACSQVQQAGQILVSAVHPSLYKEVYKLGKNHMQPVKPKESLPFGNDLSKIMKLPLPPNTTGYRELELRSSFDHGTHRVLLFNIVNQCNEPGGQSLTHLHNSYATWLLKHGFPGNYLLR